MTLREAVKAAISCKGGLGSVTALAYAADVDRSHLAHWLAGRREMETERIDRVLAAAKLRLQSMAGGDASPT